MRRPLLVIVFGWALSACVIPPVQLGKGPFSRITVSEARQRDLTGQRVRWGGTIAAVTTEAKETCFEIVSRPLDFTARPELTDESDGRFIACAAGFYEPDIYAKGREVTATGTVQASVVRRIGELEYRYPTVAAEHVYLWPRRPRHPYYYYDPYPYWWYPYWWGPWPYRPPYGPWRYPW